MTQDEFSEVLLDNMAFLATDIRPSNIATFQGKITFGDYTMDSDPLLSTWVISDLSGGHGVSDLREGTDTNRYRFGTLYTRHPNQITLPRHVLSYGNPSSLNAFKLLGDLYGGTDFDLYAMQPKGLTGSAIYVWNEASDTWSLDNDANTTLTPVAPPVAFQGSGTRKLFIPCGASGYATYTGGTWAEVSTLKAVSFCLWDNKLIALDTEGQLHNTTDGTAWTSYGTGGKLDGSYKPHQVLVYRNAANDPVVHVLTDRDVWAFDPAGPTLYPIDDLKFPPRPDDRVSACVWRGDLYISAGMGVYRYNGASVSPVGLDRDDGLPLDYRGRIEWLWPEFNGLYALVSNSDGATGSLHVFTGFGWHCEVLATTIDTGSFQGDWGFTSFDGDGYRLWWQSHGADGAFYTIQLPRDFTNPRSLVADELGDFATQQTYYLESGRFDAGMPGYRKIASALQLQLKGDMTASTITVKYRIDGATDWTTLGSATTTGSHIFEFGTPDSNGITPGLGSFDLEFRIEGIRDSTDHTTSFIIEHLTLSFLKVLRPSNSWVMTLDLTKPHAGNNPDTMNNKIDTLLGSDSFFPMIHLGDAYRVRIAQVAGKDDAGRDTRRVRQVNVIQIPTQLGA